MRTKGGASLPVASALWVYALDPLGCVDWPPDRRRAAATGEPPGNSTTPDPPPWLVTLGGSSTPTDAPSSPAPSPSGTWS